MRNASAILLVVLLTAALVLELLLYDLYRNTDGALLFSREKVAQLAWRNTQLSDELREAMKRPEELEHELTKKEHALSACESTNSMLQKELTRERQVIAHLRGEIESKDASLNKLWEGLKEDQSRIRYLEEEIAHSHNEIEGLQEELSLLKGKAALAKSKADRVKITPEPLISDLKQ
jgi:chromosome segregation ATPase